MTREEAVRRAREALENYCDHGWVTSANAMADALRDLLAVEQDVEAQDGNWQFLLDSVGECHLMISRKGTEFQLRDDWNATSLPYRLRDILRRLAVEAPVLTEEERATVEKNRDDNDHVVVKHRAIIDRLCPPPEPKHKPCPDGHEAALGGSDSIRRRRVKGET